MWRWTFTILQYINTASCHSHCLFSFYQFIIINPSLNQVKAQARERKPVNIKLISATKYKQMMQLIQYNRTLYTQDIC